MGSEARSWLAESGDAVVTEDGLWLYLDSEACAQKVVFPDGIYVTPEVSGVCAPDKISTLAQDHSWIGMGLVSLDGQPAINAQLSIKPDLQAQPVPSLVWGQRPQQWAWRIRGWSIDLKTSDLTPQVLALASAGGGPLCLRAELVNAAHNRFKSIRLSAQVVVLPADEMQLLASDDFKELQLTAQVIGLPQLIQELL